MVQIPPENSTVNRSKVKWSAIGLTILINAVLTLIAIYWSGEYGLALFVVIPLLIGAIPVLIFEQKIRLTNNKAVNLGLLTYVIYLFLLILCAIEGLICIVMVALPGTLLVVIGSSIAHGFMNRNSGKGTNAILLLIGLFPLMSFVDKQLESDLTSVTTSIEIDASPEEVWKNVVEFPQLDEPTEFLFKTGIAYPINARIDGSGIGSVRHCNFTTGSFVEPVTIWNEPKLLAFDVLEQPAPMNEISFYDLDAPHLHDYFVSKKGQFKLTKLSNGKTRLEGTTWYYHKIKPAVYWRLWSDYIIHKIHFRVLEHIKKNSELS